LPTWRVGFAFLMNWPEGCTVTLRARVRARLREAIADRRFSVHEAQELGQLASSLGVQVEMDKATRSALERFAPLWKFENWKLPIVTAPIALGQGEVCHFSCAALPG
jgi:hypothetical protein